MMETKKCCLTQVIFCLLLILLLVNFAQAGTTSCTAITSLPYTISTKGNYCLAGSLATAITSGNAVTINAGNVVLDLNGYTIQGSATADTQAPRPQAFLPGNGRTSPSGTGPCGVL